MSMTRNYSLSIHTYLAICIKQYNNWNSFFNHIDILYSCHLNVCLSTHQ